jgi:DNA-binding IclR family transcriptional regulator
MTAPATPTTPPALAEPIRKACDLFRLLAGHEVHGLAPGEIAKALNVGAPWVSVNLPALAGTGFVERVADTNRWRLGVSFVRIAHTVFTANTQAKERLEERMARMTTPL